MSACPIPTYSADVSESMVQWVALNAAAELRSRVLKDLSGLKEGLECDEATLRQLFLNAQAGAGAAAFLESRLIGRIPPINLKVSAAVATIPRRSARVLSKLEGQARWHTAQHALFTLVESLVRFIVLKGSERDFFRELRYEFKKCNSSPERLDRFLDRTAETVSAVDWLQLNSLCETEESLARLAIRRDLTFDHIHEAEERASELYGFEGEFCSITLGLVEKRPPHRAFVADELGADLVLLRMHQTSEARTPGLPPEERDAKGRTDLGCEATASLAPKVSKQTLAIAMLASGKITPSMTDAEVADLLGVNRSTVFRWGPFQRAKEGMKASWSIPRGSRTIPVGSGAKEPAQLEAWDDEG